MAVDRQRYALQTIFSFFLGLMVLAVIGVGVNTFYPSPSDRDSTRIEQLNSQMQELDVKSRPLNAEDEARRVALQRAMDALNAKIQVDMKVWAQNTSIVLVLFATLAMGVSLVRSEQLRVISNGLLLGGLFTMVYGTGYVIFSGNSTVRFLVVLFALAVTIGLGYAKFVRGRRTAPAPAGTLAGTVAGADVSELEARVTALEARAAAAAAALAAPAADDRARDDEQEQ